MGNLANDSKTPEVNESDFNNNADCKDLYGDVEEELTPKMPDPHGNVVRISALVDANQKGNVVTCLPNLGIIIFVQNDPIIWFSKRQNTVEVAIFGSEFFALRMCNELIVALRYKLHMFVVTLDGPADVFLTNVEK